MVLIYVSVHVDFGKLKMMSLTPDHFRKSGLGVMASPTPFLTPRPERRRMDPRAIEWSSNRQDRDREVNVQVVLRCRFSTLCPFFFYFFYG